MKAALDWSRHGAAWPNSAASRFVRAGGLEWHVQLAGEGPPLLLLHGTGGATHSWRAMLPLLAAQFTVIAPDLPGHAFTAGRLPGRPDIGAMAQGLAALLAALGHSPALIAGHSAGAGIALEMVRRGLEVPVIGFGPALLPFNGPAARLFPAMARALVANPVVPRLFSGVIRLRGEAARFLRRSTGSPIDAEGEACYALLLASPRHCEGALAMMAAWDLAALAARLPAIRVPVLLAHGSADPAVPLASVREAARRLPLAELEVMQGLGHLAHEEQPGRAAAMIRAFAARHVAALREEER